MLQGLDASDNMLSGGIPSGLVACFRLGSVILSNNLLRGQIPATLSGMQNLRVLHLSNNLLSGAIPASLGNCMLLEDLQILLRRSKKSNKFIT